MKKVTIAGTILADIIKRIDFYPEKGMLCTIGGMKTSVGGCVPNTGITLRTLAPKEVEVTAVGRIGKDANGEYVRGVMEGYGVRTDGIREDGSLPTSFTDVMTVPSGERTFFSAAGANAAFCEEDVEDADCELFHLGYLLLLKTLDGADAQYGTKAARLLAKMQARGVRTSVDVVSAAGSRFREVVVPALRYCDYAVVNEIEAENITGVPLRREGKLIGKNLRAACEKLIQAGVGRTAAIHCPETGCAMTREGAFWQVASLELPEGYIVGSVGAGDAFCAGMLYSFLSGMTAEEGLRLASCVAASNLSAADSVGGAKSLEETWLLEKKFGRRG